MPTLAVFQLYHGMNKFYINLRSTDFVRSSLIGHFKCDL